MDNAKEDIFKAISLLRTTITELWRRPGGQAMAGALEEMVNKMVIIATSVHFPKEIN